MLGEAGLDGHAGALGVTDVVFVGLGLDEVAVGGEELGGFFAGFEAVETGELGAGELVHGAVGVKGVDHGQAVALADLEVHLVVGGRDLECAGGEGGIDRLVGDNGDLDTVAERTPDLLAHEMGVARVGRVHGHGDVGGDGLGAGGFEDEVGDRDGVALGVGGGGRLDEFVLEAVDVALGRAHLNLLVGEGGEGDGAPVDHAFTTVDVALLKEFDEGRQHGLGVAGVHGEVGAVPIAGATQLAELLEDVVTLFVAPGPDAFEEFLATEIAAALALGFFEVFFHHGLGGDAGVVGAGDPAGGFAFETGAADEGVLEGVIEHMAHVQDAGDVGRRDDDGVGLLAGCGDAGEALGFLPGGIPFGFNIAGFVALGDLGHGRKINRRANGPAAGEASLTADGR